MEAEFLLGVNDEEVKIIKSHINKAFADQLILQLAGNPALLPWDVIRATEQIMRERAVMVVS